MLHGCSHNSNCEYEGTMLENIIIACFIPPHTGGIFSFYRNFSSSLRDLGIKVLSVELNDERISWNTYDRCLADDSHNIIKTSTPLGVRACEELVRWLVEHRVTVVVITPLSPQVVYEAIPHMPENIKVISRMTEISSHGYKLALRAKGFLDAIIITCPRQADDLRSLGCKEDIYMLPNCVNTDTFHPPSVRSGGYGELRLLFVDRLVDVPKNIFLIPKLCMALDKKGIKYRLMIVGDGPDREKLRKKLDRWIQKGVANMVGSVPTERVQRFMRESDVYIKLSKSEGSPNGLLEAMSSGLAPVASRIDGVTDFLINDGESGLLFPIGDINTAASCIDSLYKDRRLLENISFSARAFVERRFSKSVYSARALGIIRTVTNTSKRDRRPWSEWRSLASKRDPHTVRAVLKRIIPLKYRILLRESFLIMFKGQ